MEKSGVETGLRTYWTAWGILLLLTVGMVLLSRPVVLIAGILIKGAIIALWFMHLRHEAPALSLAVTLGILVTAALLFFLIVPDGLAM